MANLTVVEVDRAGVNLTDEAVPADVAGDLFTNTGVEFVYVLNGSVAEITVTAATTKTVDGLAVPDKTLAVPAGDAMLWGPFPSSIYNNGAGKVALSYSAVTDLDVLVLKLA